MQNLQKSVSYFGQFISLAIKKVLRKSQAQFRGRLGGLRLGQNDGFLIKISVYFLKSGCLVLTSFTARNNAKNIADIQKKVQRRSCK